MKIEGYMITSLEKEIEVINKNVIRVFKCKNSDKLIRINDQRVDVEIIKQDDSSFNIGDFNVRFDEDNNIIITKSNKVIFQEAKEKSKITEMDKEKVKTSIDLKIDENTCIYGLGDKSGFMNKYGYTYVSWNTDDPTAHNESYRSLYKSINFLMVNKNDSYYGIFYPCTFKSMYDLGKDNPNLLSILSNKGTYDYFLILGDNPLEILKYYSHIVGRPFTPRLKMFGNQQSRWSYYDEKELKGIVESYKKYNLPLDYVHMDIDYMQEFENLTVNQDRYPDLKRLSDEFKKDDVGIVTIYDAGFKKDNKYIVSRKLLRDRLVLTMNIFPYVNEVWPGRSIFPNYFNSECREYLCNEIIRFEEKYGIEGIWCDMNEPASFKGPFPKEVEALTTTHGKVYNDEFHNMYGEYMTRCVAKSFTRRGIRPYVITRACFATTSQYSSAWNGDNQSLWHHLSFSLPQIASMGISNFPFDGVDIGGFNGDCTKELLIRWIEANIFSPFLRNHSSCGTRHQEPWCYDEETLNIYRKMLNLRYEIAPYLYDLGIKAHKCGAPIIRPLFVNYPNDKKVKNLNDEIMVGDALLVAPIVEQGKTSRVVYVPEGKWYDYFTHKEYIGKKEYLVEIPLDSLCVLVKEGSILPKYRNLMHLDKKDIKEIIFDCSYGNGKYTNYEDDGYTFNYEKGEYNRYEISVDNKNVSVTKSISGYKSDYEKIYVYDGETIKEVIIN